MPETDAEARSRERREEERQQQELLNQVRDNNSIFDDGQMVGDNAKDWMSRHPGDAFQNIVKVLKKRLTILSKLSRFNSVNTRKINDINDSLIKIDTRFDGIDEYLKVLNDEGIRDHDELDKIRKNIDTLQKKIDILLKEKRQNAPKRASRIDRLENSLKNFQQEKRDLESDQGSMMEDIIELQKQYRTLISTLAAKEGSVGVKLIRKGSIKKSKKKYKKKSKKKSKKKKKSTKRKGSKKRR